MNPAAADLVTGRTADHDHRVDDATAERSPAPDAELLARLRGRHGSPFFLLLAVLWVLLGLGEAILGSPVMAVLAAVLSVTWGWRWWAGPEPTLRQVTDEARLVRRGLRTRTIARAEIADVQAKYSSGGYGLVLTLRGADPVKLAGTSLRFSVAATQAAALRRWAGLEG